MTFQQMIDEVVKKRRVRRNVWPATNYAELVQVDGEGRLMIFLDDNAFHPWTISETDLSATDWGSGIPAKPTVLTRKAVAPLPVRNLDPTPSPEP